jgi:molybdopterin converting factor small subunit
MAKVKVKLFGVFRVDTHIAETEVEADKLRDVFEALHEKIGGAQMDSGLEFKDALVYINGEPCAKKGRKLTDGDELWMLSPASGG